ncbi:hypothetical protein TBLA_0D04200 [Henningerozyma blattae CBS 6284]|uniref:BAR domain-containing protein n=1 Tax=Henningerozyma blattae (strain ATCC 34711 / CBS 6284 / DSM 70876 / NBRC 10599 / NRRL Y-10934 / UCD 77-7) TaxID=1071380 RepID=I2H3G5_HENB6|nr:hypothetical protein TBLA_0D04200 [Tetrapisispora blattae CBS 6284]CCH60917.1 hypothetical protein TBLA_0D04200 [Tetrapisispora blattae CBS 6284]
MSFNNLKSSIGQALQGLSESVSQKTQEMASTWPAYAQVQQRLAQEKLGQITDISQMPREYIDLEDRIDNLQNSIQVLLHVTRVYEEPAYDWPYSTQESVQDWSRAIGSRVQELSRASSASEAGNLLKSPVGPENGPRTLNYALSQASLAVSTLTSSNMPGPNGEGLSSGLIAYSDTQAKLAQIRIAQDTQVQTKFNKQLREILNNPIAKANKYRKDVQYKRVLYDIARTNLQNARPEKEASLRVEMETLEDQFAQITEEATIVMQETLSNTHLLKNVAELAEIQKNYYKQSLELMNDLMPVFNTAKGDDEDFEIDAKKDPLAAKKVVDDDE